MCLGTSSLTCSSMKVDGIFMKSFGKCLFSLQKEKKDNPNRGNVNPRKIKTRKEEWEKMKMGQEFVESKEKLGPSG